MTHQTPHPVAKQRMERSIVQIHYRSVIQRFNDANI